MRWDVVRRIIEELPAPGGLNRIISSFLTEREIIIEENEIRVQQRVYKGCPQGSCLGPVLWNMLADTLLRQEWPVDCRVTAYADDFMLNVKATKLKDLQDIMVVSAGILVEWANQVGLTINFTKTKVLGVHKIPGSAKGWLKPIRYKDTYISTTPSYKYLGVLFHTNYDFGPHCEIQMARVRHQFRRMKSFCARTWGVPPRHIKLWYRTVAERILLYGAIAWKDKIKPRTYKRLESCQRQFLIAATRAYRTAPTHGLQVLSGIPPIDLKIECETRIARGLRHTPEVALEEEEDEQEESNQLQFQPRHNVWSENPAHIKPVRTISPHEDTNQYGFIIYTDGSKYANGVGSAYVIYENGTGRTIREWSAQLQPNNSVFQAELIAIREAARWANAQNQSYVIHTDSASSISSMRKPFNSDSLVFETRSMLTSSDNINNILWVKAHCGVVGNERADMLARLAAAGKCMEKINQPPPQSYYRMRQKQRMMDEWQQRWQNSTKGRHIYEYISAVRLSRHLHQKQLVEALTGHGAFPAYLYRFKRAISPNCVCGGLGTCLHYITECPLTQKYHIRGYQQTSSDKWHKHVIANTGAKRRLIEVVKWLEQNQTEVLSTHV